MQALSYFGAQASRQACRRDAHRGCPFSSVQLLEKTEK
jgi:hypothetical protein